MRTYRVWLAEYQNGLIRAVAFEEGTIEEDEVTDYFVDASHIKVIEDRGTVDIEGEAEELFEDVFDVIRFD